MLAEPLIDIRRVKIECPACGKVQYVKLRVESLVTKNGVVSLVIKAACDHEFHLYLDKQFQVRGYERIDAVVSAEMLQVDQEISDFMKGEGIKERVSGRFIGKLRNDIERDRYLETIIRYFRGADVADSYWVDAISGHRPVPAKFEPAKAFPLPPLPSFPAPPETVPASTAPSPPPSGPAAGAAPDPIPAAAVTASKAVSSKAKSGLKGLPPPKAKTSPAPVQEPIVAPAEELKVEIKPDLAAVPIASTVSQAPVITPEKEAGPEAEAVATPAPPAPTEVPEITMEDLRAQFEARVKKINDLMIKLELENLNEAVSDIELVKKKAKLSKIKDDLEAQFNKIVSERGLDKSDNAKQAASLA
nr:hypothetical protein [Candidatus Sigynarchaeum springense]